MTPLTEEAKLVLLGLIVAVVVAGSAFTVTKLLAAGADREKAAVEAATLHAQAAAAEQTTTWKDRATVAENNQGTEHAQIAALRAAVSTVADGLRDRPAAPQLPTVAHPAGGVPPAAAPVVRASVVCESSDDLRSEYREALRADDLAADARALYTAWPVPK